jgi:hypothetical protein
MGNNVSEGQARDPYSHLGFVNVKLSWLTTTPQRDNDRLESLTLNSEGGIFYGSASPSPEIITGKKKTHYILRMISTSVLGNLNCHPKQIPLFDNRAHQLLVAYSDGWHTITSPEIFSRHSGTCVIIGDRSNPGKPYPIKIGDCFRLGSVGVVVSEMKTIRGVEQRLDTNRLQYLREEALAFDDQEEAALAAEEGDEGGEKYSKAPGISGHGGVFCYMCYETHDTQEDHLVAPCDCKGDTRYLHVQCLQKWYQSSVCGPRALVIRTTGNGAPACKICGAAYKTTFRSNGIKTNLLEVSESAKFV